MPDLDAALSLEDQFLFLKAQIDAKILAMGKLSHVFFNRASPDDLKQHDIDHLAKILDAMAKVEEIATASDQPTQQ